MQAPDKTNALAWVVLACALAGCGTTGSASRSEQQQPGAKESARPTSLPRASAAGTGRGATVTGTMVGGRGDRALPSPGRGAYGEELGGPAGTLVIYFDYDRSTIRAEYGSILQAHGAWLAANPGGKLRLEGHADERGTPEYNLALGSRRAHAVAQALNALGASDGQWATVSFGEEQPAEEGASEDVWSKNRRVELIYE